ncbi:hypothetical protein pb186bvf_003214 [Paramecium bursaria]
MSSDIIGQKMKKKYSSVDQHIRDEILDLFFAKKYSCSEISSLTGVNRSTVKAICRIYKIEGRRQKLNKHEKKTKQCINSYVCIYDEEYYPQIKFLGQNPLSFQIGQQQNVKQKGRNNTPQMTNFSTIFQTPPTLQSQINQMSKKLETNLQKILVNVYIRISTHKEKE